MAEIKATGVVNKRGKCQIRWTEGNKRCYETLSLAYTPTNIEKAAQIRARRIKDILQNPHDGRPEGRSPTFGELAQTRLDILERGKPSARKSCKSRLNNYWMPEFASWPITQIRYGDVQEMMRGIYRKNLAAKTLKEILNDGGSVFELAKKSRWITDNPCSLINQEIKKERREIDPFTNEEMQLLLKALPENIRIFYLIRYYCGLRPGEVIALRWSDFKDSVFHVHRNRVYGSEGSTKTGTERMVPVHPTVKKALLDAPRVLHSDHIINNQYSKPFTSSNNTGRALVRAMTLTGVRYRDPYNVRHSCACRMLEAGMKPAYCAKVLGHSVETFLRTYARFIDADKSAEQAAIWATI
tara:strand:- start:347 stop:1411 length:1065 start_codon:yes stop_codon:yes gene_type:complete